MKDQAHMNPFERLKEIVQVFGLAGNEAQTSWFDSSSPFCRDAERLLRAGRAAEAEEMFARVLREPQYAAVVRRQHPRILLALATARLEQQKWDEARDAALQARAMLSDSRSKATLEFADCCRLLGQSARGLGSLDEALRYILEGIAAFELQKAPRPADLVERRLEAASLLREMNRPEQAERQAQEAARVAAERLPGQKEEGDALIELAQCLAACGRFEQAREAGERAADIHRAACGDFSRELAEDYEKLGAICQKQQDYPAAVAYLEKALGVRDRQVGGDTSQLGLLLVALADLYTLLGRLAPALELLQQAVGKLGPARDANLADALEKLGAMYVRTGRYEDAADCYRRACDVWALAPDLYAERIAADVRALEELRPWLPEPSPPRRPESPDPGTPIWLDQTAPPQAAPPDPRAGWAARPGTRALNQALPEAPGLPGTHRGIPAPAPRSGGAAGAAPSGFSNPDLPGLPVSGPADPATMGGPLAAPAAGVVFAPVSPVMAAPGAGATVGVWHVHPTVPGGAPMGSGPGGGAIHAALVAMNNAVGFRRDGQALWGWEELDFETLRR
jgi:tetratricopeptide (TPR) repeat protein